VSKYEGAVVALWRRVQLTYRLEALRALGLKVKKRGWLLVIEGGKPKDDLLARARSALRAKHRVARAPLRGLS
jgi:hypothetical protein